MKNFTGSELVRFFYGHDARRKPASYQLMLDIAYNHFDGEWDTPEDCIREMDAILSYAPHTVNSGCAACYDVDIRAECIAAGYSNTHTYEYYSKRYSEALTEVASLIKRHADGYFALCQLIPTN